jgi:Uma2 family endonuclease
LTLYSLLFTLVFMIFFAPIFDTEPAKELVPPKYDGLRLSLDEFLNSKLEDPGYKYEWNRGVLEAEETVKESERYIIDNICRSFVKTKYYDNGDNILPEADVYLEKLDKYRRPDAVYFTKDQIRNSGSYRNVPLFILELISPSNSSIEVENKILEYFQTGVQNVWLIYPSLLTVKVYYSTKAVKICSGKDICDTGSVLPNFQMTVDEIFKRA